MTQTDITPTEHSDLVGGSTAARRIGCPRSYAMEQKVPKDDRGSVYAQEGTALHDVMAIALERDVEPTTMLPFTYTDEKGGWSFTVDETLWIDKGEPALQAFDRFVAEQEERLGDRMHFLIEKRVAFPGIDGAFGTADIIARCGGEIFMLDWKFGRGIVPADENKQLLFYACGALNDHADFFEDVDFDEDTPVTVAIIQPERDEGIDVWRTNVGRLQSFEFELQAVADQIATEGDAAPIQDGPWCRFARCKSICPLHIGAARKLADRYHDLQAALTGGQKLNDWPQRYADLLELVDIVEDFCSEVRDRAHHAAEQGMEIPGWALEAKRAGGRKWAVEDKTVIRTLKKYGYKLDDVAPRKVLTLPQAEKILKRDGKVIPDEFVERPEPNGTKLVRAANVKEPVESTSARVATLAEKLMNL